MELKNLIDIHTHGAGKYDTMTSRSDDILKIAEIHGNSGTAAIVLSIYPQPVEKMRRNMEAVKEAIDLQESGNVASRKSAGEDKRKPAEKEKRGVASRILGVHLEGPFLNGAKCGALDKSAFVKPSLRDFDALITGYEKIIRTITVAPELPGILPLIKRCTDLGIRVNMGHSEAGFDDAERAKRAGATGITHIFNGMRPFHHRDPGLAGFGLIDGEVYIEVIADGCHLHPAVLELIFRTKRPERIILISDSVKNPAGRKAPVYATENLLAGSGITLPDEAEFLIKMGIPEYILRLAGSENPARYLGLALPV